MKKRRIEGSARYRCAACGQEWDRWSETWTKRHNVETGHVRFEAILR